MPVSLQRKRSTLRKQKQEPELDQVDENRTVGEVALEVVGMKDKQPPKGFVPPVIYRSDGKKLEVRLNWISYKQNEY